MARSADPVTASSVNPSSKPSAGGTSAQSFVDYATQQQFLNTRYVDHTTIQGWGPGTGWDCSSFTAYVMKKYGVKLPAYSDSQYQMGQGVARADLQPGDLVFYHTSSQKKTGHVAIYIGGGKVVNALNPGAGTVISNIDAPGPYVGARRVINLKGNTTAPPSSPTPTSGSHGAPAGDPAPRPDGQDTLSIDDLAASVGFTGEFLQANPDLEAIWTQAVNEKWNDGGSVGQQKFINAIHASDWWKKHSDSARNYLISSLQGGRDFDLLRQDASAAIQAIATKVGADVSDPTVLDKLTTAYLWNGWDKRPDQLAQALTGDLGGKFGSNLLNMDSGNAQNITMQLRELANANGVKFDEGYYNGAVKMVVSGMRTVDDYMAEIRDHAASLYPAYKDRIAAGENAADIASPYMQRMADTLELNRDQIKLDDPWISRALGGVDEKGNPAAMPLWGFDQQLRKDPRWQSTNNAYDSYARVANHIAQTWGLV
jgi:hypothetical protein